MNKPKTKLAWIRKMRGLSQTQLAKKAGCSVWSIKHFECGHRRIDTATADLVWKIATALETSMESLLEHDLEDHEY